MPIDGKVCEILLSKGKLTPDDMKKAGEIYTAKGGRLCDILVKIGVLSKADILAVVNEITGYPLITLSRLHVDEDLLKIIPKRIADQYQVVPVSRLGNFLTIAMVDPLNIFAIDDIKALTKLEISPVIADRDDMKDAISSFWDKSAGDQINEIVDGLAGAEMEMVAEEKDEMSSGELLRIIEETPVIKLTNMILSQAVKEKASDVLIEPMENGFRVRYRIDGVLYIKHTPPKKYHCALISRLKVMANLNIAERRLPQDGRLQLRIEDRPIDFRLAIMPSISGEKASLRILDKEQTLVEIEKLGLSDHDLNVICANSEKPHGMVLVCGPTGSGKTTTLYSILKHLDSPGKNLVTVEDPVEYELKGINQVSVNTEIGLTFAGCLRAILRQDPDIILLGEIRDLETVDIAIKAALTGHMVLSTLHTNTACGSIVRLVNMGVEPFLIASSVVMIVAQRLIRRICQECRQPYTPSEEIAKKYGLYDKNGKIATIYKPGACSRCMNSGYKGRIAIVECLEVTPVIKDMFFKHAGEHELEKQGRSEGMVTLRENGIRNVLLGITSLEEVLRVTAEDRKI